VKRLYPMSVGDILDGTFGFIRDEFRAIAVIIGTVIVPVHILLAFLARGTFGGAPLASYLRDPSVASSDSGLSNSRLLLSLGTDAFLLPFAAAAIALVISGAYLGRPVGPGEALRRAGRRFPSLMAAWIAGHVIEGVGFAFCVLPGIAVMTLLVMVSPIVVIENLSFGKAISRSMHLAGRRFWFTLGVILLSALVAQVVSVMLTGAPDVIAAVIGLHWGWLALAVASAVSALVVTPIAAITATLLYFDARVRTEGYDLEVLAMSLG
jgi:hypothetical protein